MLDILRGLDEAQRVVVVGIIVQYLVQALKWLAEKAGLAVEEAKVSKLVTAALMSAVAALLVTGYTTALWQEWLLTFLAAVTAHEVGNKLVRKATDAALEALAPCLLALAVCCLLVAPVSAAPIELPDEVEISAVAALDGGPTIGGCLSYEALDLGSGYRGWLDLGVKKDEGAANVWLGASTNVPRLDRVLPVDTRWGMGYLFGSDVWMLYVRTPLRF